MQLVSACKTKRSGFLRYNRRPRIVAKYSSPVLSLCATCCGTNIDRVCYLSFTVVLVITVQHVDSKVNCGNVWLVAVFGLACMLTIVFAVTCFVQRRDNALIHCRPTDNHLGRLCEWRSMTRLTGDAAAAAAVDVTCTSSYMYVWSSLP